MTAPYHTALAPFIRGGQPVPLTAGDYALRFDLGRPAASNRLRRLVSAGLVSSCPHPTYRFIFYELTDEGLNVALDRQPPVPSIKSGSDAIDVTSLAFAGASLPLTHDAQIGEMMRRSVPRQFRPTRRVAA